MKLGRYDVEFARSGEVTGCSINKDGRGKLAMVTPFVQEPRVNHIIGRKYALKKAIEHLPEEERKKIWVDYIRTCRYK